MPLPKKLRNLWKVKIQDKELLYEQPHVTIWAKAMTTTTELHPERDGKMADRAEPLDPHWVEKDAEARRAARSEDRKAVWIVRDSTVANRVVQSIVWPSRRAGYLVLLRGPRPELLPALMRRFERVAYADETRHFLPRDEMTEALKSPDRKDRFLGGIMDEVTETITLWRGDLSPLVVPFSAFQPPANGINPDWSRFAVTDYGHTLRFGSYEAASDALLYEYDEDFRRRQNALRQASERTLGASIRRLRRQRALTRNDFPGLDSKTLARIERGEVVKPRARTLVLIAGRLGVAPDELATF